MANIRRIVAVAVEYISRLWNREIARIDAGDANAPSIKVESTVRDFSERIFQPSEEQITKFSRVVWVDPAADKLKRIVDGLPYTWYPTVSADQRVRVLHPGPIGRRLFKLADQADAAREFLAAMQNVGVRLPNGGLAFYYPKQIRIARLEGPDYVYSGMTAADVLAGYTAVLKKNPSAKSWCDAREAFLAMSYPWDKGGVNLAGRAILELPLFRSAPEIVLNGWLHALLFLQDYVTLTGDAEAADLLNNNVKFLASTLSHYDDETVGLSRYSDLSPYSISITCERDAEPCFYMYYKARCAGLDDVMIPLRILPDEFGRSLYDNQLISWNARTGKGKATISFTQKYDGYLVSNKGPFTITIDTGRHDWQATVPKSGGKRVQLASQPLPGQEGHVADLQQIDSAFRGNHTAFTKEGRKNYYHVQHVVALLYLARSGAWQKEDQEALTHYAVKWLGYMQNTIPPLDMAFATPQEVFAALHRGKAIRRFEKVEDLLPVKNK